MEYKIYMISQVIKVHDQPLQTEGIIALFSPQSTEDGSLFNRGSLLNIGFILANQDRKWDCIILHDIDKIPENEDNVYKCSEKVWPRRFSDFLS